MALIAKRTGLWDELKAFCKERPVWGTCAGLILLSNHVENAKQGGQDTLKTLPISVLRNRFGAQTESFYSRIYTENMNSVYGEDSQPTGVFIRAPIITNVDEEACVLARLENKEIVAVKYRNILGCAFHPELTKDISWHLYFVDMVKNAT